MAVTTKESMIDQRVLNAVLALPLQEQAKLVSMLSEQLPPSEQVRLILQMLPNVAPTVKAALRNKTLPIIGGGTPEDALKLVEAWLNQPATDEDDASWDEIMHNLSAYDQRNTAA
ncbi:hypothetical protein BH10CHL1_BH10CHL1_25530 [soil metagenome]